MTVWNRRTPAIASAGPPPVNSGSPVSPLKPWSRLSPSAPTIHTLGSERPSVVVTIGAPAPRSAPHHAVAMLGGAPARSFSTVRSLSEADLGHWAPAP